MKKNFRFFVRMVTIGLLLGLLVPQLFHFVFSRTVHVPKEERPSGQPLQVNVSEDDGVISQFVIKWKELTR